jgi:hypothetical protein
MVKTKHVKLFEDLDNTGQFEEPKDYHGAMKNMDEVEPEFQPPEEDEDDQAEKAEMTAGELRAYEQGLDVLTVPQMAAMWIKAKDRIAYAEDRERIEDPAQKEVIANQRAEDLKRGDWTKATYKTLAAALELKDMTVTRTVTKFKRLILGQGGSESEVVYPKIIKANEKFSNMSDSEVRNLADSAVTFAGVEPKLTKSGIMSKAKIAEARERYVRLLNAVKDLAKVNQLMYSQYKKMGYTLDDVNMVMVAITKDVPFQLSAWNSYKRMIKNKT